MRLSHTALKIKANLKVNPEVNLKVKGCAQSRHRESVRSPTGNAALSPEQLGRLREARRKAQPSVQFEIVSSCRASVQRASEVRVAVGGRIRAAPKVAAGWGQGVARGRARAAIRRANGLNSPVAAATIANAPAPASNSRGGGVRGDSRRSGKEREKQDRRREDLEHFANQVRKKKSYTDADVVPKEISIMESITVSELARENEPESFGHYR